MRPVGDASKNVERRATPLSGRVRCGGRKATPQESFFRLRNSAVHACAALEIPTRSTRTPTKSRNFYRPLISRVPGTRDKQAEERGALIQHLYEPMTRKSAMVVVPACFPSPPNRWQPYLGKLFLVTTQHSPALSARLCVRNPWRNLMSVTLQCSSHRFFFGFNSIVHTPTCEPSAQHASEPAGKSTCHETHDSRLDASTQLASYMFERRVK